MTMKAEQFLPKVKDATANTVDGMIQGWLAGHPSDTTWESELGEDNLDIVKGDGVDLNTVVQMNTRLVEKVATQMQGISEAARVRRDLNISDMSRIERFVSGIRILEGLRYNTHFTQGKHKDGIS